MRCYKHRILLRSPRRYSTHHAVSDKLLNRANNLLKQHTQLAKEAAADTTFTEETANRQRRLRELELFKDTFTKWKQAQHDLNQLQELITTTDDPDLRTMAEEDLESSQQNVSSLSSSLEDVLLPQHPHHHLPALMEIRSGIGGDEATLFAHDLYKMYEKYATLQKWKITTYSISRTENDGLTEAIISISGPGVFGALRSEAGVHRVQRTPATESKGRVHTSTVSINVLPDLPDQDFTISDSEFKIEVMRSRGAGGQHVNRTESAVRLTHIKTGITVSMQDSRSQHANKRAAFTLIRAKLAQVHKDEEIARQAGLRRIQVGSTDRSEKIRTFNFSQNRVTDHRVPVTSHDLEGILGGGEGLSDLLKTVNKWQAMQDLDQDDLTL